MMTNIRESKSYLWSTDDFLGKGATGVVYKGINKNNGELVAIKVLDNIYGIREVEMLRKINHENIVKFLAIETETLKFKKYEQSNKQILVTELCTGGCLSQILEDPENIYGLDDSEFLLFLSHLYSGMKYLRDNNIVHRDVKPGNIMKYIKEDGTFVYKLIDFGTARNLPDEKGFESFCGTEEYLFPDMYERALLGAPNGKSFHATVDLWSTGVTLYHVVTGELPFRPFGGRRNRQTMHYITTRKAAGVISGIQHSLNSAISWSKELPKNCLLSPGLRKIITPLIAGLLESNEDKIWSFKEFFENVESIITRKIVHVFNIQFPCLIKVYLKPIDTIIQLQDDIYTQLNILPENQILIYKGAVYKNESLPKTSERFPLFIFSKEIINKFSVFPLKELPPIVPFCEKIDLNKDFIQAKKACCNAYIAKRLIEGYSSISQFIYEAVENMMQAIKIKLEKIMQEAEFWLNKYQTLRKAVEIFEQSQTATKYKAKINNSEELMNISKKFCNESFMIIKNLYEAYNCKNVSNKEWERITSDLKNPFESRESVRALTLVNRIKDSMIHLKIGRDYAVSQNHQYLIERNKIVQTWTRLIHLLEIEVYHQFTSLIKVFESWFNKVQKDFLEIDNFNEIINEVKLNLKDFEDKFDLDVNEFKEYLNIDRNNSEKIKYINAPILNRQLKNKLKGFSQKTGKTLMAENAELMNKINECTSDLDKSGLEG